MNVFFIDESIRVDCFPVIMVPDTSLTQVLNFVPQQEAWVIERFGKYHRIQEAGIAWVVPFLEQIAYVQSLKEMAIDVPSQSGITSDNVTLDIDGVLYVKVGS